MAKAIFHLLSRAPKICMADVHLDLQEIPSRVFSCMCTYIHNYEGCDARTHQLHGLHQASTKAKGTDWRVDSTEAWPGFYRGLDSTEAWILQRSGFYRGLVWPLPDPCMFRITEAYSRFSIEEQPLVTTMYLRSNQPLVEIGIGLFQKGSVLSYQQPAQYLYKGA
ncbi:hypothetical protein AALO_G00034170 [Alosa alosa]|uniref:Uncharacterized protein n=1 Tax=Alosa alosa TaxID=278164 RepID=A0AAV6HCM0_9TELE|nr:hypothetical protein AALO_G00034170 [Alosa alosa]